MDSVHCVHNLLRTAIRYQELLENWYSFASEHGQYAQEYMECSALSKFNRSLIRLAISWVSFVCDDCDVSDRKTFRCINALNPPSVRHGATYPTCHMTSSGCYGGRSLIIWCYSCITSMSSVLAQKHVRRRKDKRCSVTGDHPLLMVGDQAQRCLSLISDDMTLDANAYLDASARLIWDRTSRALQVLEGERAGPKGL